MDKFDFMYDVLSKKMERQNADYNAITNKANSLFAFTITLFAGFFAFVFGVHASLLWNLPAFALFIITIYAINQVLKPHVFKDPPPPDHFYTDATLKMNRDTLKNTTISTIDKYYKYNVGVYNEVVTWLSRAQLLLFTTLITIIVINIFTYERQSTTTPRHSFWSKSTRWHATWPSPSNRAPTPTVGRNKR
jgi:hypothetical protein